MRSETPPADADTACMRRIQAGDSRALGELIERWEKPVLSFAYRYVGDLEAARDLTMETFERVYRARARYDPGQRFSTWLFAIAANLGRNYQRWRRRHREAPLEEATEPLTADEAAPHQEAARRETAAAVAAAVGRLPHSPRVCLLLHYYEGMSYREIAAVTGGSERGVESRLYRARKALAKELLREPRTPGAATSGRARASSASAR